MALNNALLIHQFKRKDYEYRSERFLTDQGTYDRSALLKEARRQAKAMNQRLLRLERAGLTNSPAYKGAVKALSGVYSKDGEVSFGHITGQGKPRYKENVGKLSNEELMHLLYATSKTSQARTSTVGAVKKMYAKGAQNLTKIAKQAGLDADLGPNDLMQFFQSKAFAELNKIFGYKAVLQSVSEAFDEMDEDTGEDKLEQIEEKITDYVDKFGKIPENLIELRKLLGLESVPKLSDTGWHHIT